MTLPLDEADRVAAIEQAFQRLARDGLIVDSGRRRLSEQTGSYQIVWVSRICRRKQKKRKTNF